VVRLADRLRSHSRIRLSDAKLTAFFVSQFRTARGAISADCGEFCGESPSETGASSIPTARFFASIETWPYRFAMRAVVAGDQPMIAASIGKDTAPSVGTDSGLYAP
jgi:hypothetical protein